MSRISVDFENKEQPLFIALSNENGKLMKDVKLTISEAITLKENLERAIEIANRI